MPSLRRILHLLAAAGAPFMAPGCGSTTATLGSYSSEGGVGGGSASGVGGAVGDAGASSAEGGAAGVGGSGWFLTFDDPVSIEPLYAAGEATTDPAITGDGLELYFMSTRGGSKALWHSTRSAISATWEAPELVAALNTDGTDSNTNPRISEDGLRIWFFTDRDRTQGTIWEATRASRSDTFGSPAAVPVISSADTSDVSAAFNQSVTIAIVATLISSKVGYELIEWRRTSISDTFANGVVLANVNSTSDDFDPWLSADGLVLVFHSARTGNDDLYWASRTTVDDSFSVPVSLTELNSTSADTAPSLTADHRRIVFASTREGDERLYEAVAPE